MPLNEVLCFVVNMTLYPVVSTKIWLPSAKVLMDQVQTKVLSVTLKCIFSKIDEKFH